MAIEGNIIAAADLRSFTVGLITETFTISGVDVDMMAVDLVGGEAYEIDVDNGNDSYLRIFDAFGVEVQAVDDGFDSGEASGLQPYVQFMANYTGRYYIAFSPYYLTDYNPFSIAGRVSPENPLGGGSSNVFITQLDTEFYPDANSINVILAKGSFDESDLVSDADRQIRIEYVGSTFISPGSDVEMGRFDLVKGDRVVVDVNGRLPGANVLDAVLRVFDDGGNQIGIDNGSGAGEDSELFFVAPNTDDFYIAVSGEGNSTYNPLDGTGTLVGDEGAFTVIVHRNPTLVGTSGSQVLNGTDGDDYIVLMGATDSSAGGDGHDTIAGGDDSDTLRGGNGKDQVYGEFDNDSLFGDGGEDVVAGGQGDDQADGGAGNDVVQGGIGDDTLLGGTGGGKDTLHGDAGNDSLEGDGGDDTLFGGFGQDTLKGEEGKEALFGDAGSDQLFGGAGADTLDGGLDNDTLNGDEGFDVLFGNLGFDVLLGGVGSDTLDGGAGDDTLTGGTSNDTFVFTSLANGFDTISDFDVASTLEFINLSAIFAATGSVVTAGNLSQFVQCSPVGAGADSFLGVDADGLTGGLSFTIIAQVNLVTPAQLFDFGNFIV